MLQIRNLTIIKTLFFITIVISLSLVFVWLMSTSISSLTTAHAAESWYVTPGDSMPAGAALYFDGIDDQLNMGTSELLMLSGTSFTVEAWILTTHTNTGWILGKHEPGWMNGYGLTINHQDCAPNKACFDVAGDHVAAISSSDVNDGQWHHIAGVYDVSGTKRIYVDGFLEDSEPATVSIPTNIAPFRVGYVYDDHFSEQYKGLIDEVRVWNVARTEAEIQSTMNTSLIGTEPGLVGYWKFDEGNGQAALDSTANGNNGQLGSTSEVDDHDPSWYIQGVVQNDDFDAATEITGLPFTDNINTSEATWSPDDPIDCTSNGSVWYAFTPATDMRIEANTFGSDYDTVLSVYTGTRGALSLVPGACNDDYDGLQSRVQFDAIGGTPYYFLIGKCCGYGEHGAGNLVFSVQELVVPPPPANDNFSDATVIDTLPFSDMVDTTGASMEAGEPSSSCVSLGDLTSTVWYIFTPAESVSVSANANAPFGTMVAVYTGNSLADLTEMDCRTWGGLMTFRADANNSYYIQVGSLYGERGSLWFNLDFAPPPEANFGFYPYEPSTFDTVWFYDWSWDPAQVGIDTQMWDFGDGATASGCCPSHRYASDGDHTVQLAVTTFDGRIASTSQIVQVRTHDVSISKIFAPMSAKVGQTRTVSLSILNRRYPERVRIELYKSVPGGFEWIATSTQFVPVRPGNRTTQFAFNYTFSPQDAEIGKVTFMARAYIENYNDAIPADNEAISIPPTKVN